jgi:hypothetical protein
MLSNIPTPMPVLIELFNYIDSRLRPEDAGRGCDRTLRFTREFIRAHDLNEGRIIAWLGSRGGYCDCEVLSNVETTLEDTSGDDPYVDSFLNNLERQLGE